MSVDRKPRCTAVKLEVKAGDEIDMATVESLYRCFYGENHPDDHKNANGDQWPNP